MKQIWLVHRSLVDDNVDCNLDDHERTGDDGDALGDLEVVPGGVTTEEDCLKDQLYTASCHQLRCFDTQGSKNENVDDMLLLQGGK